MWKCKCGKINQGDAIKCISCIRTKHECTLHNDYDYREPEDIVDTILDAVTTVAIVETFSPSCDDSYDSGSSDE